MNSKARERQILDPTFMRAEFKGINDRVLFIVSVLLKKLKLNLFATTPPNCFI